MNLNDIATRVVDANRSGETDALLDELYADDAVSVEAMSLAPGMDREKTGLAAIREKHAMWNEMVETHSVEVQGPFPHGDDRFAVIYTLDSTVKMTGERTKMSEVAVYHVADGKVVREEFFYAAPGA